MSGAPGGVTPGRLIGPVVAVLAVVAVIGVLLLIGQRPVPSGGPAAASRSVPVSRPPRPTAPATAPAAGHSTGPHDAARRASAPARGRPQPVVAPVSVLNNSTITGLAHRVAARLQRRGWPIAVIGNFTGRLPQTTLYYLPGQRRVAERLARQYPGITRLAPRPSYLPGRGLTLVLTRYWVQ